MLFFNTKKVQRRKRKKKFVFDAVSDIHIEKELQKQKEETGKYKLNPCKYDTSLQCWRELASEERTCCFLDRLSIVTWNVWFSETHYSVR